VALALAAPVFSQSSSAAGAAPMTIQVVLAKGEGEKKVSAPYSLIGSTGEIMQLRVGVEAPVATTMPNGQTQFMLQQIGTQFDLKVDPVVGTTSPADGRYKIQLTITKRDFDDRKVSIPQSDPSKPIFTNFIFAGILILRNGETAQIIGTDLLRNESWQADVTLLLKK
jgi:hypothetical protein